MVAAVVLLDIIHAVGARTLFRKFTDGLEARCFLSSLVSFFATRSPVFILLTRLALVPIILVDNTGLILTCYACKYVAFNSTQMDLTRITGPTPAEVSCDHHQHAIELEGISM
jgi:hypothetical protein